MKNLCLCKKSITGICCFPTFKYILMKSYVLFLRNFYNWTMHFRHDADIFVSYGPDLVLKGQKPPYSFATTHKVPNQSGLNL